MSLDSSQITPLMAITLDGAATSHLEQTRALLSAGVRWIQLRQKSGSAEDREKTARAFVSLCREAGAVSIMNDSVELTLLAGADGVHLGKLDGDWRQARERLGPKPILGGTINSMDDVERAVSSGALDYVGVGPWRFTTTKKNLSAVLGAAGIAPLVRRLSPLPAWVIGGVLPEDLPAIRSLGAAGVAVSGGLVTATDVTATASHYFQSWSKAHS